MKNLCRLDVFIYALYLWNQLLAQIKELMEFLRFKYDFKIKILLFLCAWIIFDVMIVSISIILFYIKHKHINPYTHIFYTWNITISTNISTLLQMNMWTKVFTGWYRTRFLHDIFTAYFLLLPTLQQSVRDKSNDHIIH